MATESLTFSLRTCGPGAWLDDQRVRVWLAEAEPGHAPVGYLGVAPAELPWQIREDDLEVKRIYLLHRVQARGLGKRLMMEALFLAEA